MLLTPKDNLLVCVSYFGNIDSSLKSWNISSVRSQKKCLRSQSPKPFPPSLKNLSERLSMLRSPLKIRILPHLVFHFFLQLQPCWSKFFSYPFKLLLQKAPS